MIIKIFRKVVILAAATIVESRNDSQSEKKENCLCRPSELPIYIHDDVDTEKENNCNEAEEAVLQYMENLVLDSQKKYENMRTQLQILKKDGEHAYSYTKGNVQRILDYLRAEENLNRRIGAISLGALLGLLFGWKKRFFKKTLYTLTGGLAAAAVCYPNEAKEYSTVAFSEIKNVVEASVQFLQGEEKQIILQKEDKQDIESSGDVKDPVEIIKESHDESVKKSCHCPIGSCLHRSDEVPPKTETEINSTD